MSTTATTTPTSAPTGKGKKALSKLLTLAGLALLVLVAMAAEATWHFEDGLPGNHPDGHLRKEARKVVGQTLIEDREDKLLKQIERNPNKGIDEVNKVIANYQENVRKLENGPTGNLGVDKQSEPAETAKPTKFEVLASDPVTGQYKFQLDGRMLEQELTFEVSDGDTISIKASSGRICTLIKSGGWPCTGPAGNGGTAKLDLVRPSEFPVGDAGWQELVGYVGTHSFPVGQGIQYQVPIGTGATKLRLGPNVRKPEAPWTTGGFVVEVKDTPK